MIELSQVVRGIWIRLISTMFINDFPQFIEQSKLHVRLQICSKLYSHRWVGGLLDFVVIIPSQPSQAEARLGFGLAELGNCPASGGCL